MPEVFRVEGFVFFFYANEGNEPIHIHVRKAGGYAKFWIMPVELDSSKGFKSSDLMKAEKLINENIEKIKEKWYNVFGY
ncbi:MAG: DUF4160 domain-containing protein [Candidatus Kapabacteria bacterium]|nr:DUF4160 domain-containing protein [Ignavibacteriota bacterium]MCW5885994.1 DUF4160 domain-containing protein [Candidatus Kapabacteria bacterium]